jgi:hypothetical protein
MERESTAKHLVDQSNHCADDFGRRVVRAGLFSQVIVVDLEEILVEVKPSIGIALADRRPVDGIEYTRERAE